MKLKDRREQRGDRASLNSQMDAFTNLNAVESLAKTIGDREIAMKIVGISKYGQVSKSELVGRYKNIVYLLSKLNYRKKDIISFVKKNKNILYLNSQTVIDNYNQIAEIFIANGKTRSELVKYIDSSFGNRSILLASDGTIAKMINLITKLFKSKGFKDYDLNEYLFENRNLLMLNADSLLEKLALLNGEGLDEQLMFEKPYLVYMLPSAQSVNNAIKCMKEENIKMSLENIDSYAVSNSKMKYKLPSQLLTLLTKRYDAKLEQRTKEGYKRTL